METKTCSKCGETKPLTEFYRARGYRLVVQSRCKDCTKAASRNWYADNAAYARTQRNDRWQTQKAAQA